MEQPAVRWRFDAHRRESALAARRQVPEASAGGLESGGLGTRPARGCARRVEDLGLLPAHHRTAHDRRAHALAAETLYRGTVSRAGQPLRAGRAGAGDRHHLRRHDRAPAPPGRAERFRADRLLRAKPGPDRAARLCPAGARLRHRAHCPAFAFRGRDDFTGVLQPRGKSLANRRGNKGTSPRAPAQKRQDPAPRGRGRGGVPPRATRLGFGPAHAAKISRTHHRRVDA